jgi:OOP family OmpA-OmpF porin
VPKLVLTAILALLIGADLTAAEIKHHPLSLHLEGFGVQPALNDSAQVWSFRPGVGGTFQFMLSQHTGFQFRFYATNIYNDTSSTSLLKYNRQDADRRWEIRTLALGPKFYLSRRKGSTPYLYSNLDLVMWKVVSLPDEQKTVVADKSGNPTDYEAMEMGVTAGIGIESLLWSRLGLSAELAFTYLTAVGADFAQSVENARSRGLLRFGVGLSYHFGFGSKSLRDKYEDRLTRPDDNEVRTVYVGQVDPETGDTVFVDQSRPERREFEPIPRPRRFAPDDSDLDGVRDKDDRCPDTPEGALVDRDGCPNDADGDQVLDGIDLCEETPAAARDQVDQFGCPRDSDFDGVPDYYDECRDTPPATEVDSVGCTPDADGDGVDDSFDICPDTPAGIPVNLRGCADYDLLFGKRVVHSLFLPGDTEITGDQAIVLDSIATYLNQFPDVYAVIYGYTDNLGPDDANLKLSQKRATSVLRYLTERNVNESRLKAL